MSELTAQAQKPPSWIARHPTGFATLVVGVLAIGITAIVHFGAGQTVSELPDWRLTTPFAAVAVVLAAVSLLRKEGAPFVPIIGIGLCGCAMALGWILALAVIVGVTLLIVIVMSQVM